MSEKKIFSLAFRDWRKRKDLTQKDVADKMGMTRTIISFLENGKQKPQLHHLNLLKEKFDLDLFDTVQELSDVERAYYGPPKEAEPTTAMFMEMYNAQKAAKEELLQASDLLTDLEEKFEVLPKDISDGMRVIKKLITNALRKI